MRAFLLLICCSVVIGAAYWSYKENYQTRASITRVKVLQQEIAAKRTAISILTAEWAYLNRPNRLRDLVDLNYPDLQLLPLLPEHFVDIELVAYPQIELNIKEIKNPVSVLAVDGEDYP